MPDDFQPITDLHVAPPLAMHDFAAGVLIRPPAATWLVHVVLDEDIEAGDIDGVGNVLDYDATAGEFVDTAAEADFTDQTVEAVADPKDGGLYLAGERHLCVFDPNSGLMLPIAPPGPLVGKADSSIAGISGDTPGSGTVSIYKFDNSGALVDTTRNVTAYNTATSSVAAGAWLHLLWHNQTDQSGAGGKWLITFEDCG